MKILVNTMKLATVLILVFSALGMGAGVFIFEEFPSTQEIRGCLTTTMYKVHLCPSDSNYTKLKEISANVQKAVLMSEDGGFYQHHGFEFEELKRSLRKNMEVGHFARGGSTISQQLAKNLFLTEEKTIFRKIKEAVITLRLEQSLSKKEILEKYLNVVHWGPEIFGIKKAAQFYFHKSPGQLSLVESAFLAMLLPSPERYSKPFLKNNTLTPFAQSRIRDIIDKLYRYNRITEPEYSEAQAQMEAFNPKVDSSVESYSSEPEETEEPPEN
jgi:monofunctional biosynthetic peptidoglycan transglycosylase